MALKTNFCSPLLPEIINFSVNYVEEIPYKSSSLKKGIYSIQHYIDVNLY